MPVPQPPSAITGVTASGQSAPFAVDPPVIQDADYAFTDVDRLYLDSQARGAQQHIVQSLISGVHATWVTVDPGSAAIGVGKVVCLAGTAAGTVTLGTPGALQAAGMALGVALSSGGPGAQILVALAGILPPSVTGLTASPALYAIANPLSGAIAGVSQLGPLDFAIGTIDAAANLTLLPAPPANNGGAGTMWKWPQTSLSMTSDANVIALSGSTTELQQNIKVASTVSLTATRNVVLPLISGAVAIVYNATTGAQSLQFIGASGSGTTVANGKRAFIGCDGTNWFAITAPN